MIKWWCRTNYFDCDGNYSDIKKQKWDSEILSLIAAIYKEAGNRRLP